MQGSSPVNELSDVRAEIARLKLREASLSEGILAPPIVSRRRPGWPIHREPGHASIGPPIGNAISRSSPFWIAV